MASPFGCRTENGYRAGRYIANIARCRSCRMVNRALCGGGFGAGRIRAFRQPSARHARLDLAELLQRVNALGIGPQGLGGVVTALGVNVEVYPTHIAGLPVAVNLGCHSMRRMTVEL